LQYNKMDELCHDVIATGAASFNTAMLPPPTRDILPAWKPSDDSDSSEEEVVDNEEPAHKKAKVRTSKQADSKAASVATSHTRGSSRGGGTVAPKRQR
jgi:hypothetical protein